MRSPADELIGMWSSVVCSLLLFGLVPALSQVTRARGKTAEISAGKRVLSRCAIMPTSCCLRNLETARLFLLPESASLTAVPTLPLLSAATFSLSSSSSLSSPSSSSSSSTSSLPSASPASPVELAASPSILETLSHQRLLPANRTQPLTRPNHHSLLNITLHLRQRLTQLSNLQPIHTAKMSPNGSGRGASESVDRAREGRILTELCKVEREIENKVKRMDERIRGSKIGHIKCGTKWVRAKDIGTFKCPKKTKELPASESRLPFKWPYVLIALFVRNKAHSLPYMLGHLERQTYAKSRLHLLIRVARCDADDSAQLLRRWLQVWATAYASVDFGFDEDSELSNRGEENGNSGAASDSVGGSGVKGIGVCPELTRVEEIGSGVSGREIFPQAGKTDKAGGDIKLNWACPQAVKTNRIDSGAEVVESLSKMGKVEETDGKLRMRETRIQLRETYKNGVAANTKRDCWQMEKATRSCGEIGEKQVCPQPTVAKGDGGRAKLKKRCSHLRDVDGDGSKARTVQVGSQLEEVDVSNCGGNVRDVCPQIKQVDKSGNRVTPKRACLKMEKAGKSGGGGPVSEAFLHLGKTKGNSSGAMTKLSLPQLEKTHQDIDAMKGRIVCPQLVEVDKERHGTKADKAWPGLGETDEETGRARGGNVCAQLNGTTQSDSMLTNWSLERQQRVAQLYQLGLDTARRLTADYMFLLDADVLLTNREVLRRLVSAAEKRDLVQVSPLLDCLSRPDYPNIWLGHQRQGAVNVGVGSDKLTKIMQRRHRGILPVGLAHTALLVRVSHLSQSDSNQDRASRRHHIGQIWPPADGFVAPVDGRYYAILALAAAMRSSKYFVDNRRVYGYFPSPVDDESGLQFERDVFAHLRVQIQIKRFRQRLSATKNRTTLVSATNPTGVLPLGKLLPVSAALRNAALDSSQSGHDARLGQDAVYLLNLHRRSDRLALAEFELRQLGIQAERVEAVDGQSQVSPTLANLLHLQVLPGYRDPTRGRQLTRGEVGCLLSHVAIWRQIVDRGHRSALLLEDDVRFTAGFRSVLRQGLAEADTLVPDWDLLYLGRKPMRSENTGLLAGSRAAESVMGSGGVEAEQRVSGSQLLRWPGYSYWTLSYLLTRRGAEKLLAAKPLRQMMPVDEFLSVMFNRHPNADWSQQFAQRNLIALSLDPLIVEPMFHQGERNVYISDTENSDPFE